MLRQEHGIVIIGGGPGGYTAAIRAAQLGLNVACVEKETVLGGTCLRIGCIPSKALLESSDLFYQAKNSAGHHGIRFSNLDFDLAAMHRRKEQIVATLGKGIDGLFRKHRITRYRGQARIAGPGRVLVTGAEMEVELKTARIVIATGSRPANLRGIEPGGRIATSTEALALSAVPNHLVVVGGGAIGLELGSVWARLGSKITVLDVLPRILPGVDDELALEAQRIFEKQGLEFRLGAKVAAVHQTPSGCTVRLEPGDSLSCDRVLIAVGREPNTAGLGLETVSLKTDAKGRLEVNDRFETSTPGIYAIGDVIPGPMLAHRASADGVACIEAIAGKYHRVDYNLVPAVVYTEPELASVGKTETQLKEEGIPCKTGVFTYRANGRAHTLDRIDGKMKIVAHAATDRVLGVHILGARAGDLIAEGVAAMAFGASSEDIARCPHAHPSLNELYQEAALAVDQRAIHS